MVKYATFGKEFQTLVTNNEISQNEVYEFRILFKNLAFFAKFG